MESNREMPIRKRLPHEIPSWAANSSCYFITICTTPKGQNQLATDATAASIAESFSFNMNRHVWWVDLMLIMPDHLHAMMRFSLEPGIGKSISDWKRYSARMCHVVWQRDFFEHRLRNDESHEEKSCYIRMNPVRAGFVKEPQDWLWVWTAEELDQDGRGNGGLGTDRPTQTRR